MERDLHERDRVGVQDLVLLEDFKSENAFIDNLQKRFKENLIYVSLISSQLNNFIYLFLPFKFYYPIFISTD